MIEVLGRRDNLRNGGAGLGRVSRKHVAEGARAGLPRLDRPRRGSLEGRSRWPLSPDPRQRRAAWDAAQIADLLVGLAAHPGEDIVRKLPQFPTAWPFRIGHGARALGQSAFDQGSAFRSKGNCLILLV